MEEPPSFSPTDNPIDYALSEREYYVALVEKKEKLVADINTALTGTIARSAAIANRMNTIAVEVAGHEGDIRLHEEHLGFLAANALALKREAEAYARTGAPGQDGSLVAGNLALFQLEQETAQLVEMKRAQAARLKKGERLGRRARAAARDGAHGEAMLEVAREVVEKLRGAVEICEGTLEQLGWKAEVGEGEEVAEATPRA